MSPAGSSPDQNRAVHQFVPALIPRDATGSHTLLLRAALREAGWRSEIFAEATHDELSAESIKIEEYPQHARDDDVLIYQFSTSSMVADFLAGREEALVINYHNVTGPEHYDGWEPATAQRAADALEQLAMLAPKSVLGLADSPFNELDLISAGCPRTAVVPVLFDRHRLAAAPDPRRIVRLTEQKGDGGADWLFVGRIVPSKAQHELIKAFWAYRHLFDPDARLHLVGSAPSASYVRAIREFTEDLGLSDAVHLAGEVTEEVLAAYFQACEIYVSLSVHEGFGVPLIEAMAAGIPVVALGVGAVAGTIGDAGLVLAHAEPSYVAGVVHRVLTDADLRGRLVRSGRRRSEGLSLAAASAAAIKAIATVAGDPRAPRPAEVSS